MKLTEKQLRNVIKNTLMEMIDPEVEKEMEMQDMYDEYSNRSQYMSPAAEEMYPDDDEDIYKPGFLSMMAQGGNPKDLKNDFRNMDAEPDNTDNIEKMLNDRNAEIAQNPEIWASKKPGSYKGLSGEMYESKINKIVAEAIKKSLYKS